MMKKNKYTIKVDRRPFMSQLRADLKDVALDMGKPLKDAVDTVMSTSTSGWQWPREPRVRDIIDTGKLKKSGRIYLKGTAYKPIWEFRYSKPYAAITYYGGYMKPYGNQSRALVYLPPRPWVEVATSPVGRYGFEPFPWQSEIFKSLSTKPSFRGVL
jgi:hypothetical protein